MRRHVSCFEDKETPKGRDDDETFDYPDFGSRFGGLCGPGARHIHPGSSSACSFGVEHGGQEVRKEAQEGREDR